MVTISKYYSSVTKTGVRPSNPGNVVTVIPEVLNPPDSPVNHSPVTIGSPANGLSLVGQELSLALASSGVTGALSGTDWSTFNGKIGGTIASGQVAFGTGVNTVGGDAGLTWNNTLKSLTVTRSTVGVIFKALSSTVNGQYVEISSTSTGVRISSGFATGILGSFDFSSGGGNSFISFSPNNTERARLTTTGQFWIGTTSGTNTLDVNGTTRIRTISNAVGNFLTTSATGVVQQRTAGETRVDIGAFPSASLTIASGQVAFGTGVNTVGGDSGLLFNSITKVLTTTADAVVNGVSVGRGAGAVSTNTRVGNGSLNANTTGSNNTASGYQTLNANTTANNNTANGYQALFNNTTGQSNTASGANTLRNNTTGGGNTASGNLSLQFNTEGNGNTANGVSALSSNTTGDANTASGSGALYFNTTGSNNTANGYNAGRFGSGSNLTIANNSIFIGVDTEAAADNQTNQIVIGYQAIGQGSNTTTIGNTSITDNYIRGNFNITDAKNIVLATGTGTKIGTSTTQKLAFWNSTPIVQPTTAVTAATLVSNLGTPLTSTDTFDGYTLAQIVKALRNTGLLA